MILLSSWKHHTKKSFFHHLNSLDSHIKFTVENTRDDGSIPFLDTLITRNNDGSLQTKVYRKPTHTNQYLKRDSHHAISNKYSVISSLLHRANYICSSQELLEEEQKQIQESLVLCKYPMWAHQQNENKNKCSQKQQKQQPKQETHMQRSHHCTIQ